MRLHVRCAGKKRKVLAPGGRLRIGRSPENDLVLDSGQVSRFHAEIVWDADEDVPAIVDLDSANGVLLDGDPVEGRAHLPPGCVLEVGEFELHCELKGSKKQRKLMESSGEIFIPFAGPKVKGSFESSQALHQALLKLERTKRSGTLLVDSDEGECSVTIAKGRAMDASFQGLTGLDALERILALGSGSYQLSPKLMPSEAFLNVSFEERLGGDG